MKPVRQPTIKQDQSHKGPYKTEHQTPGNGSFLQWFYDFPIRRKQLVGLFTSEVISIVGLVGVGAFLIVSGGRTQLRNQAKSELAVTEIHYNIKINQMGFGFRGQSDNAAIIAAAKTHDAAETIDVALREQVQNILRNEIQARQIEYATLVGADLRIIVNANADRSGEKFNPNNLVSEVLAQPRQIKTSEVVSWQELLQESPPLLAETETVSTDYALVRYTVTPVIDPQTQEILGALVSGDVVNGKPLIVNQTVQTVGGGYSAVYLRQPLGTFTLATAVQDPEVHEIAQPYHPNQENYIINVPLPDASLLTAAVEAKGKPVSGRITVGKQTYTVAAKSLPNFAGEQVAILVRGTPETRLNSMLKDSLLLQILVSVLALTTDVILAIVLGRAIARPIKQLQGTTKEFSTGNMEARAQVFATDEVGELAVTFNQMADSILTAFSKLEQGKQEQLQLNSQLQQEIADRQQAEERLRLLESAVVNAQDGILITEADPIDPPMGPKIVYVNQACSRMAGYSAAELLGQTPRIFQGPKTQRSELDKIRAALLSREAVTVEVINHRKDGSQFWSEINIVPLVNAQGQLTHFLGVMRDRTESKQAEAALQQAEAHARQQAQKRAVAIQELKQAQAQLVQSEKMSSLGQMVAGVAHEINNPVSFIYGNINHANEYITDLLELLDLYQEHYPHPVAEIQDRAEDIDLEFILEDLPHMLNSMHVGADRIREIVLSLRNFSRLDESELKQADIHEGIDSTLLILQHRLRPQASSKERGSQAEIQVIKEYGNLPLVQCYPGQLNQVFMNILANAIDALEESVVSGRETETPRENPQIEIRTQVVKGVKGNHVAIAIRDNGPGIPESVRSQLFDPFFTTKPVGKGTGLGLSISYQIVVKKHHGRLKCQSVPGQGTQFLIAIPILQPQELLGKHNH
ncbi:MAG: ATP-binding protein [Hormoscilla sp.]